MSPRADHGEDSYRGHGRLKGMVALITGGDSGIGRAVALAYAREGADVAFTYLSEENDAATTSRLVEDSGQRAHAFKMDQSERADCDRNETCCIAFSLIKDLWERPKCNPFLRPRTHDHSQRFPSRRPRRPRPDSRYRRLRKADPPA